MLTFTWDTADRGAAIQHTELQLCKHSKECRWGASAQAKRILVVDDSAAVRDVVRTFLERSSYLVHEAANGAEAITKSRQLKPDLIVMDLVMPDINGIEATSVIRSTMPKVPIIAFTMYENLANSVKSKLAISSIVSKPDGITKVVECIQSVLGPVS